MSGEPACFGDVGARTGSSPGCVQHDRAVDHAFQRVDQLSDATCLVNISGRPEPDGPAHRVVIAVCCQNEYPSRRAYRDNVSDRTNASAIGKTSTQEADIGAMTADRLDCTGEASGDRRYAESLPYQYCDQRFYEHRVVVAQYDTSHGARPPTVTNIPTPSRVFRREQVPLDKRLNAFSLQRRTTTGYRDRRPGHVLSPPRTTNCTRGCRRPLPTQPIAQAHDRLLWVLDPVRRSRPGEGSVLTTPAPERSPRCP